LKLLAQSDIPFRLCGTYAVTAYTGVVLPTKDLDMFCKAEPLEIFPFLGNSRLTHTVDQFDNARAVVHGHAHRGVHKGKTPKGVPVYDCAQTVALAATGRPYALFEV
jgi:hypothetical protein